MRKTSSGIAAEKNRGKKSPHLNQIDSINFKDTFILFNFGIKSTKSY